MHGVETHAFRAGIEAQDAQRGDDARGRRRNATGRRGLAVPSSQAGLVTKSTFSTKSRFRAR